MPDIYSTIELIRKRYGKRLSIMAHHYECDEIVQHADYTGDSLELARHIPSIEADYIVFCGVSFMGETAAILAKPGQKVILPEPKADCQMARMAMATQARTVFAQLKERGISFLPLAYVNTEAALKAVVGEYGGAVCTSANADTMLRWAYRNSERVLFLPDKHLGRNTARKQGMGPDNWHILAIDENGLVDPASQPLDRHLLLWPGYCCIHDAIKPSDVGRMRGTYPDCRIVVHPEADPEVVELCDGAGSTSFLIKEAQALAKKGEGLLVVGTEFNLVNRLTTRHRNACTILPLFEGERAICPDMAMVTEAKLLHTLENLEIARPCAVSDHVRTNAKLSLDRMLEACK